MPSIAPTSAPTNSPASAKGGTYANERSLSKDGALSSYVPLQWHSGHDATARYAEKDAKAEGSFYEKIVDRTAAALTESTRVRSLNGDLKPADASLTNLVQAIQDEASPNFQIAVSGGRVTPITQVVTP
jgi:hypothetical protein